MINDGFIEEMSKISQFYETKDTEGFYHLCKQLMCMANYVGASRVYYLIDKIIKMFESHQSAEKIWFLYPSLVEYIQEYAQFLSFEYQEYYY